MIIQNSKLILFGSGYWGTNIANNLVKLGISKFLVFDKNLKNSQTLKKRYPKNVEIIKNIEPFFKNKNYKYFIFATPPSANFRLIKKALKYKKNIFIEKPGFKDFREIDKLIKLFPKETKKIMFGYIYMFNNHINFIKRFCNEKKNGKILYMKFQRQNLGPIRNDVDVSYDLSSHDLSIIKYIFPKSKLRILNIQSYKLLNNKISDLSNISLKLNNTIVDINNSWLNPDKIRRIIIITQKKMLLFDEMLKDNKIKIFNKYASYPKIEMLKNNFFKRKIKIYLGKNYSPKIINNDPLKDEIKNFLQTKKKINKNNDINFAKDILKILNNLTKRT